jgi:nucleoside recognition membrane protein YjiH
MLGILLFMVPIKYNDEVTIPIAILSGILQKALGDFLPAIMTVIIILTLIGTLIAKTAKPDFVKRSPFFTALLDVPVIWAFARLIGAIFAVLTLFKIGPEWIWSENTGGLLLNDLLPILFSVFFFAGLLLPLLLNFGLLELFGSLLAKFMRPVFKLPGRSSVDCVASWLGDGTIGVLLTSKQYEEGFYTKREAAIIGTSFSVVSITFSLVVISQVNLGHMFVSFYLTVTFAGIIAALVLPRIPPLSTKPDNYYHGQDEKITEAVPKGFTPFSWGYKQALVQADKNKSVISFIQDGTKNVLDMALGTIALMAAEFTPVFDWLGMPFIPLLELMQIPEAKEASKTLVVGFADMFLPTVLASEITSEMTRFIIACVSVTQLIYMSEVGGLLLGSKIPVSFKDLVIIFLLRTVITLPVIVGIAHMLF